MARKNVYIRKTNEEAWNGIENPSAWINDLIHRKVEARAKFAELDAVVNDGVLVEVCKIFGHPLYMRVNHNDPDRAKYDLAEVQSVVKETVIGGMD